MHDPTAARAPAHLLAREAWRVVAARDVAQRRAAKRLHVGVGAVVAQRREHLQRGEEACAVCVRTLSAGMAAHGQGRSECTQHHHRHPGNTDGGQAADKLRISCDKLRT